MKILSRRNAGRTVAVLDTVAVFDQDGIAETGEKAGAALLSLPGYTEAGQKPKTAAKEEKIPVKEDKEKSGLESLSLAELKKLVKEKGAEPKGTKKSDLIAALAD